MVGEALARLWRIGALCVLALGTAPARSGADFGVALGQVGGDPGRGVQPSDREVPAFTARDEPSPPARGSAAGALVWAKLVAGALILGSAAVFYRTLRRQEALEGRPSLEPSEPFEDPEDP